MIARRLARLSLVVADAEATAAFYRDALGFARVGGEERGPDERATILRLGRQTVELLAPARPAPYPPDRASNDPWFQHFAIIVADMRRAFDRLHAHAAWTPISFGGPVRLPASSGGVTAFKFRDPEGHPLELLEFPPDQVPPAWQGVVAADNVLGIDHTAIVVADTEASVRYYERLGFSVTSRTLNRGLEQERLDGLHDPIVEVTALALPEAPTPHLELLRYRAPRGRPARKLPSNDVARTSTVLESDGANRPDAARLRDPDGHDLLLQAIADHRE